MRYLKTYENLIPKREFVEFCNNIFDFYEHIGEVERDQSKDGWRRTGFIKIDGVTIGSFTMNSDEPHDTITLRINHVVINSSTKDNFVDLLEPLLCNPENKQFFAPLTGFDGIFDIPEDSISDFNTDINKYIRLKTTRRFDL